MRGPTARQHERGQVKIAVGEVGQQRRCTTVMGDRKGPAENKAGGGRSADERCAIDRLAEPLGRCVSSGGLSQTEQVITQTGVEEGQLLVITRAP